MASVVLVCEDHVESDREDSSHDQHLEHEVVERSPEERKPGSGFDLLPKIVSKLLSSFWEVSPRQADLEIDLQLTADTFNTYTHGSQMKSLATYHQVPASR